MPELVIQRLNAEVTKTEIKCQNLLTQRLNVKTYNTKIKCERY